MPPWLDAGRSFGFLDNELDFVGLRVHLGRWTVKNVAVIGVIPRASCSSPGSAGCWRALRPVAASTVVRFAVLAIVLSELLFLRFPFKPLHLLPVVACVALLRGASPPVTQRWLVALVAAQLIGRGGRHDARRSRPIDDAAVRPASTSV